MRNLVLYFLTVIFFLFMAEKGINVKSFPNDNLGHVSHSILKKVNFENQNSKNTFSQALDDDSVDLSLELFEDDFHLSDSFTSILFFTCVFGLIAAFAFTYKDKNKLIRLGYIPNKLSERKFIFLRTIRI